MLAGLPVCRRMCTCTRTSLTSVDVRASLSLSLVYVVHTQLANLFIMHTSASLTINENCDPDVRHDMESALNRMVGSGAALFRHMDEVRCTTRRHAEK